MKHLHYILSLIFLCLGIIAIALEEQLDPRIATESQTGNSIGCSIPTTCFISSTDCILPAPQRSLFNDENSNHWISEALSPISLYMHAHALSKLLRLKVHLSAGQLGHLISSRLSAGDTSKLTFTPNALRYSCGYYIFALEQILI